jgi:hypothetical protein
MECDLCHMISTEDTVCHEMDCPNEIKLEGSKLPLPGDFGGPGYPWTNDDGTLNGIWIEEPPDS